MKRFDVEIEKVNGYCSAAYKEGERFLFEGYNTPADFCGGAYTMLFPILVALNSGARFDFEKNPYSKSRMACPDNGNVIFTVTLLED